MAPKPYGTGTIAGIEQRRYVSVQSVLEKMMVDIVTHGDKDYIPTHQKARRGKFKARSRRS